MSRGARIAALVASFAAAAVLAAALAGWLTLRASLPKIEGTAAAPGLTASVTIARDAAGVPTISAANRVDLARGLGYVHGQDRFFEMDLMRRAAAGELSALFGAALLPTDRELRVHRFRAVAQRVVANLDPSSRALLDAYVDGVNQGLESLRSRPFEYWVLRGRPQPWNAADSVLCVHAMFLQLQQPKGQATLQRGLLRAALPPAMWKFLNAPAPEWEAAIDATRSDEPQIPRADEYDLRSLKDAPVLPPEQVLRELSLAGSNNWAVAGTRTANGAAIVADDMHLDFRVPIIWYRARMRAARGDAVGAKDAGIDLTGVTLPGTPGVIAGSNGHIAWGFTNSYGEFATVVRLVPSQNSRATYQTAHGPEPLSTITETIVVHGAPNETLPIVVTPWGPVVGKDWEGRPYALQWSAENADAVNFKLLELEHLDSVADAVGAAPQFGIPAQNFMVADRDGHIGWTIAGRIPKRGAAETGIPQLSTDAAIGFSGWLPAAEQPRVIDPPTGLLWSANNRVIGGAGAELIGDDEMNRGARASQIHDDLEAAPRPFSPAASLRVQLDDRTLFLERWRTLLAGLIDRSRAHGDRSHDAARAVLATWSGHAAPADAAYRLVHAFRGQVEARTFFMLVAAARLKAPEFEFVIPDSFEGPLWRLMEQRPQHLLAANYADWDALLLDSLQAAERLPPMCQDLASCTWGSVNELKIEHPLSAALPWLSSFLNMPIVQLPGAHGDMPRIQGPDYGASERFSVAPGYEEEGYFNMPGGESGHPLSPFYRAGFAAWADARATPFLPGPPEHTLTLTP